MSNPNILPSNQAVVAGVIDPDALAADTYETGWIDMRDFEAIQAIVLVGALGTNATVDAKLEEATDDQGGDAQDIDGKEITQLTEAGTDESDSQAIINCRSEELDVNDGYRYVRLSLTIGTATSDAGAVVLGHYARYQPADAADSVAEVIS